MKKWNVLFVLLLMSCLGSSLTAQTIIDLNKGDVRAKTLNDYQRQEPGHRNLSKDSAEFKDCVVRAFNALATDSLQRADRLFRQAINCMPRNNAVPALHHQLGLIAEARGQASEAVKQYTEALRAAPDMSKTRLRRAYAYLQLNNLDRAEDDCKQLLEKSPEDTTYLFLSSTIHVEQRLYAAARSELEKLTALHPTKSNYWIALAYVNQNDGRPKEAAQQFDRAVVLNPQSTEALAARAGFERLQKHYAAAQADLDKAIGLQPSASDLYLQRASLLLEMKEKSAARTDLQKAVELGIPRSALHDLFQAAQ